VVTFIVLVRVIGSLRDAGLVGAATRSAVASGALALAAAPIAGAIGLDSPGRALIATVVAGTAGLAAYVGVLVALRSDDVASLLETVRRRRASASGV
jgi:hypothetical protein